MTSDQMKQVFMSAIGAIAKIGFCKFAKPEGDEIDAADEAWRINNVYGNVCAFDVLDEAYAHEGRS